MGGAQTRQCIMEGTGEAEGMTASRLRNHMRILYFPIIALAAGLGAAAHAQLPLPFGPEPDLSERLQCTTDYVRSVEARLAALEKLRAAGPDAVGRICTLIEKGSAWLGGELPEGVRRELRSLLGVDVDLKRVTA